MRPHIFQPIFAMTFASYFAVINAYEDHINRLLQIDYAINDTYIDLDDPNIYSNGTIIATNYIGSSVMNKSVGVNLFRFGCEIELSKTGLEVELSNVTEYMQGGVYQWKIQVIPERLTENAGGLVNFTQTAAVEHKAKGVIQFCTRVSSWLYDIQVGFRENNYELSFDNTNNTFEITGIGVEEDDADEVISEVSNPFSLNACQCENFNCITDTSNSGPIQQGMKINICLTPTSEEDADVVEISNFNVQMTDTATESINYDPVIFGEVTWSADPLTQVQVDPDSNTVMVILVAIAPFFIEAVEEIEIFGNAFLQFVSNKNKAATFYPFALTFNLETKKEPSLGCFKELLEFFLVN